MLLQYKNTYKISAELSGKFRMHCLNVGFKANGPKTLTCEHHMALGRQCWSL